MMNYQSNNSSQKECKGGGCVPYWRGVSVDIASPRITADFNSYKLSYSNISAIDNSTGKLNSSLSTTELQPSKSALKGDKSGCCTGPVNIGGDNICQYKKGTCVFDKNTCPSNTILLANLTSGKGDTAESCSQGGHWCGEPWWKGGPLGIQLFCPEKRDKAKCDNKQLTICGTPDFAGTIFTTKNTLSLTYTAIDGTTKKPFLAIDYKSWQSDEVKTYFYESGILNIEITGTFDDTFVLSPYCEYTNVISWINSITQLPDLLNKYLTISTITNIVFTDFTNQLYPSSKYNRVINPSVPVEKTPDYRTYDVETYVNNVFNLFQSSSDTSTIKMDDIKDMLMNGTNITLMDFTGKEVNSSYSNPIIHTPLCGVDKDVYTLTFTVPYNQYMNNSQNIIQYTVNNILIPMLKDNEIKWGENAGSLSPGNNPSLETLSTENAMLLVYKIHSDGNKDTGIPNGTKLNGPDPLLEYQDHSKDKSGYQRSSVIINYIPYIVGVTYTLKVKKWSPMLLLYFLNEGKTFTSDSPVCQNILNDTNILPTTCLATDTTKSQNELITNCKMTADFGALTDQYNIPDINQKIIINNNQRCNCLNSRIAPYNQVNTEAGVNANLCFNQGCKDDPNFRTELINKILGGNDVDVCRQYCDVVAGWLTTGVNMQHANEIDSDLFKKICGANFSPLQPFLNKKVLYGGIFITILLIILSALICKKRNFSGYTTSLIIVGVLILFSSLTVYLAWECSGQTYLYGPSGGPYENKCKSRKLNITLPSDFCPKDLGSDCMFDQDCVNTGCTAGCIAQLCTPGESQKRQPTTENKKYIPVFWCILSILTIVILNKIIFDGLSLTKYNIVNKWYKFAVIITVIIICILPPLILGLKGENVVVFPSKCTANNTGCCVPMKNDSDPDDKDVCNKVKDENKCGTDATTINCIWETKNCV